MNTETKDTVTVDRKALDDLIQQAGGLHWKVDSDTRKILRRCTPFLALRRLAGMCEESRSTLNPGITPVPPIPEDKIHPSMAEEKTA